MSNKKIFKKLYFEKINKDNNYKAVLKRIENNELKSNPWQKVLVPICSLITICGLIFLNVNEKGQSFSANDQIDEQNKNYEININNNANTNSTTSSFYSDSLSDIGTRTITTDYEKIIKISHYQFLVDLKIPTDLDNRIYQEVYIKENQNSDYNVLQNYTFLYQNTSKERYINLSFSDKYQPLRDYIFTDNEKISKINNTEIIIYQNKNIYIAIFTYNNINFDIETNNITQEELINILSSIIK